MEIVFFPHPTLRHKSKPLKRVDSELKDIVSQMFELMYKAKGIGLAANQVDLPLQLFVINLAGKKGEGEELVFMNPVIDQPKGSEEAEEGCLSLPGVNGRVNRPAQIHVSAYDINGNEIDMVVDGLMARAIQHEYDHLQGVMFIDRMSDSAVKQLEGELDEFRLDFQGRRAANKIPDDDGILKHLTEIEDKYC